MKLLVCIPTTKERRKRLENCMNFVREGADVPFGILSYENNDGGWTPAVRNMLKMVNPKQLVIVLGDDCEPEKGFMSPLVQAHEFYFPDGDGLVQPNDTAWGGKIASFPCATAEYLLKWTYSGYIHAHADEELANVSRARGKYMYLPESIINHRHYQNTQGIEYDNTYKLQENTWVHDKTLFDERVKQSGDYANYQVLEWDNV